MKQQRDQTRTFLASWKNYEIEYQVNKDEIAEQAALTEDHFGEKERTEAQNAEIRYSKKNKKFVIVKQVAGTQIDEERLRNYVDKTLEAEFQDQLLTGEVKIDLNQQAYKQPSVKASKELKKELKSLNGTIEKIPQGYHNLYFWKYDRDSGFQNCKFLDQYSGNKDHN